MSTSDPRDPRSKAERAQALLREQQRKERIRRWSMIGGVVAVIVIVAVVLAVISINNDPTGRTPTAVPTSDNTGGGTGAPGKGEPVQGYSYFVGKSSAPTTITLYEDLQCPICKAFENATRDQVQAAIDAGKVRVEYRIVSFLDRSSTTNYSSRAANAAAAVYSTAGPDVFKKFHDLLYEHQPPEGSAGLPDSRLVAYAVQAGADKSKVQPLVDANTYHQWVVNATDQMSKNQVTGTPTIFINGKRQGPDLNTAYQAVLDATK